jgi:plasmid stabilization system protein ParE
MVKKPLPIRWDSFAFLQLQSIVDFIRLESPSGATKVSTKILSAIKLIKQNPIMHPPDKLRLDKNKNYRAFEIYHYRITYYIAKDHIRIIRLRHTSREPLIH